MPIIIMVRMMVLTAGPNLILIIATDLSSKIKY